MPTMHGARYAIDLSIKADEVDLADNDVVVVGGIVPWAGTVKEIWVGLSILPTTGTLAVAKAGTTLLSAATTDLSSSTVYTAHTASQMTLTSSNPIKKVAAGDILTATWTLTDSTVAGADDLFLCTVIVEPDVW